MRSVQELCDYLQDQGISFHFHTHYHFLEAQWDNLVIDSRKATKHCFFVGLQGAQYNGGAYVKQVCALGAGVIMVEEEYETLLPAHDEHFSGAVLIVKNSLEALSRIAHEIRIRHKEKCRVIGVTGSAGKTSTKSILYQLLGAQAPTICSEGNLNTVQGLSQSIINLDWHKKEFGVFECGISTKGEMAELVKILSPDIAIVTNVGHAHLGGYDNIEEIRTEKLRIAQGMSSEGILWLPDDDDALLARYRAMRFSGHVSGQIPDQIPGQMKTHGTHSISQFSRIEDLQLEGSIIHACGTSFRVPLLGSVNAGNVIIAIQVMQALGFETEQIRKDTPALTAVEGRYSIVRKSPYIIDDSYNANPEAVKSMLDWVALLQYSPKIVVLGGMKEMGRESDVWHQDVVDHAHGLAIDHIFLYGEEFASCTLPNTHSYYMNDIAEMVDAIDKYMSPSSCIILKGSRFYALESVSNMISKRVQEAKC